MWFHMAFAERRPRRILFIAALAFLCVSTVVAQPAEKRETIRVALDSDYAPYSFRSPHGDFQGILVDQWAAWEKSSGIRAEIHDMDWSQALQRMRAGEFDVIDTIVATPERRQYFDFTPPYLTVDASIFFRDDVYGITDIASLKGFPVGVKAGDQHIDKLKAAGVTAVISFRNYNDMIVAAKQRRINVFVADTPAARYLLQKEGIASEFRRSAPIFRDELRRAVRKGDVATLRAVTEGFDAIPPAELKKIDEKWLGGMLNSYGQYAVYGGWVAIAALLLIVVLVTWNRMLSRRILQRTAELRESEQRFRQIAENIREVFWLFGVDTEKILYVSPACIDVCGQSPEALYADSRNFFRAVHPEDLERVAAAFENGREEGFELEYRTLNPDGSTRWIRDRGFPIRDEKGRTWRLAGIAEDITDRKVAADALQKADRRIRLIIETIPAMAWSVDTSGAVDFVNQRWLDFTGLTLAQAVEGSALTIHPDDLPEIMERWAADMAACRPFHGEMRLRRHDGEYCWFLIRTVPLFDDQGKVVKWYGTSTEIEDRKRAEDALARSENRLAEAQRTAHVGSWEWDLRSESGSWSDECYRIFGVEPGSGGFDVKAVSLVHPGDRELVLKTSQLAVSSAQPYEFYYRIIRDDGSERVLRSIVNAICEEGVPVRLVGATQDVTLLRRAEEDLRTTTEQLRALSARIQSTREEEGTRIAREIHDELGATLTSLRWEVEGIRKKLSISGAADVDDNVVAVLGLIDTMISEVRRIASDLRPVVLDVLGVEEAIEWQAQQFQERTGIPVHCESGGNGADLNAEQATALFRIFQEALTNTLRHARATRVDVTMDKEGGEYVLTIKDNGRGITDEEKTRQSSVGLLGMRERASLIGGELFVDGARGRGTTVTVRLPITAA
jgi:PAS domain S-box-containing protein